MLNQPKTKEMAAIVEDTCPISDVPHQQIEKEESSHQTTGVPSLKLGGPCSPSQREPLCEAGGTSAGMENGSLPVAVPERHMSPALNCVETSTNDSGVSNASSVTSDSVPHIAVEMAMPPLDVDIGQRQGYRREGSEETGVRDEDGEKLCVAASSPSRKEGEEEEEGEGASACSDVTGDLEALELSKDFHEVTGGEITLVFDITLVIISSRKVLCTFPVLCLAHHLPSDYQQFRERLFYAFSVIGGGRECRVWYVT